MADDRDQDPLDGGMEAAAMAAARREMERLRAMGDRLHRIGAATAGLDDAEARAAIQDANLAAYEETGSAAAEAALARMREMLSTLSEGAGGDARAQAIRAAAETAARDIETLRQREGDALVERLKEILAGGVSPPVAGAPPTDTPGDDGKDGDRPPDWEPFAG